MPYDPLLRLPVKGQPGGSIGGGLPSPASAGRLIIGQGTTWASKTLSGDATITSAGVLSLSTTGVTPGTYGDGTHVGQFTVDAAGRLSFAANVAITVTGSTGPLLDSTRNTDTVSHTPVRGDLIAANSTPAWQALAIGASARILQSDGNDPSWVAVSADATLAVGGALTLATVNANVGTFGGSATIPQLTVNGKGLITAVSNVAIGTGGGGLVDPSRWIGWRTKAGVNTTTNANVTLPSPTTDTGTKTTFEDATGNYVNYATSTSSGVSAGVNTTLDTQLQLLPDITFVIKTGATANDIVNLRLWIGLSIGADIGAASAANTVAFRFSPTDGDTKWASVTVDSGGTAEINTGLGATVTADTQYVLRIQVVSTTSVNFYINGTLVSNHTLHFPAATTNLGEIARITNNSAGTARAFRRQSMVIAQL